MKKINVRNLILKIILGITALAVVLMVVLMAKLYIATEEDMKKAEPSSDSKDPVIRVFSDSDDSALNTISAWFGGSKKEEEADYSDKIEPVALYDEDTCPRIVCLGDSLTQSTPEKIAYPDVLAELSQFGVVNLGREGDLTKDIARRVGSSPIYLEEFTIPAGTDKVTVHLVDENGKSVNLLKEGDYGAVGINICKIGDIKGNLTLEEDGSVTFARRKKGDETVIKKGTRLITGGEQTKKPGDVMILFSGANDDLTLENVDYFMEQQQKIVTDWGTDKYIIISPTYSKDGNQELNEIADKMQEAYGEHFLDIRRYLIEHGLDDAGVKPTSQDKADMKDEIIPSSLRSDYVHGNAHFYRILAEQLYRKMMYLGYLPLNPEYAATAPSARVVFWGDSLTQGTKGEGVTFPDVVRSLAARDNKYIEIRNYGVYAEDSSLIAARSGAVPLKLSGGIRLPAEPQPVKVRFTNRNGKKEDLLVYGGDRTKAAIGYTGDNSVNPCILGGIEGDLSINGDDYTLYFTRKEAGEEVSISGGEEVKFWADRDCKSDDILVIWTGNNDIPKGKGVKSAIQYQKSIIERTGTDKYIVLNFTKIDQIPNQAEINQIMAEEYGEHLLDINYYLMHDALNDLGITPTPKDLEDLAAGRVPESIRQDEVCHFKPDGYRVVGQQVYKKLCELGYL